ncbi:DNA polymerase II [uncultured Ferrimonas sp.]|uniref:DNA polymerase II n=1 Tax=uncultured Ferrimonas sp. TaxID=432640 RepID=UPI00262845E0|nr:DNA polymerase II [uncultured Ferrimonas sp.]
MQNEVIIDGWLLGREQRATATGLELVYWLSGEQQPHCVVAPSQPWQAFILAQHESLWRQFLANHKGWQLKPIAAQNFQLQPVLGLYVYQQSLWQKLKQHGQSMGWPLLEADIRSCDRFLMERFVRGAMTVRSQDNQIVAAKPGAPNHQPKLVSLDIECSRDGVLYSVGFYSDADKRVLMVGQPTQQPSPDYLHYVADEAALLHGVLDWFERFDPDGIIGWAVASFDLALLQRRAAVHRLRLSLGRDGSEPRWQERAGPGRECNISGRLVLDGIEWLRAAFYHFDSFALDNVAFELLGEGKVCDDSANRMDEIEHNFHHNKPALAHYNLKDCELVWRIFAKTKLLEFVLARGQITGIELDRLGGSVAAFTFRYLPLLHRAGFVAPDLLDTDIEPSPGGYVMDSVPGRFQNVLVLDFKSLYPSIIRSFLIDPMGMVSGAVAPPQDRVEGFRGAYFHRQQHRLPEIVAELAQQRELAKQAKDQPLSQAIKILMNSFYGVLGAGGCRFHHPHLASSITLRGHQIMKQTRAWIEAKGYRVIYGDTDSTFVHVGDQLTPQQAQAIGPQLVKMVNDNWRQQLQQLGLESALELEYESHYRHFFMPTIRGSEKGSKKRYVGVIEQNNKTELVFKGMETVRSDWTPLAREFQQQLYRAWFANQPIKPLIKALVSQVQDGQHDSKLIYKKRLRRPLADYQANAPHVHAATQANLACGQQKYRKGSTIRYGITAHGAVAYEQQALPLDHQHYIDKQIRPIVEPILALSNDSFDQLLSNQLGLGF